MSFDILFLSFNAGKIDGDFDANRLEFKLSCIAIRLLSNLIWLDTGGHVPRSYTSDFVQENESRIKFVNLRLFFRFWKEIEIRTV
jgi:hypothetical protein